MSTAYKATPTTWDFLQDQSFVRVLLGPIGSGKSVTCIHEILRRATQQAPNALGVRKTRWGVIRNTVDQLRSTTLRTLFDWFPDGVWGTWKATEKTFHIQLSMPDGTTVACEVQALALDHPDDVRKALSLELTGLFINEAREVAPEVVDGLLMRLRRYPSKKDGGPTWSGAIMDSNPPDQDTWFFDKLENPPANWRVFKQPPAIQNRDEFLAAHGREPETPGIEDAQKRLWYINPSADNLDNLDPAYYPDIIPGKSEDFIDVYLRCRYGRSLSGVPVYDKTFNADFHLAKDELEPIRAQDYPVIIGLDFGRTPAAVFVQRNVRGQLVVLAEATSSNMGIETFVRTVLRPVLTARFSGCAFLVAPDPAGFFKQQIGEISPVDVLRKEGFKVDKPVTNDPERRIQAVERQLTQNIDGKPALLISPACKQLVKGMRYGYRYKLNRAGSQDARPDKNEHSHVNDALQYACLVAEGNQVSGSYDNRGARREIKIVKRAWT